MDSKVTALNRVAYNNNLKLAELLISEYKADPNRPSSTGETPLISAVRRNHVEMVRFLLEKGADPNYVDHAGFMTIDYAILQGFYEISFIISSKIDNSKLRSAVEYSGIGKKYQYRYVNYEMFLEQLLAGVEPEKTTNFLHKKKVMLSDPVIDHRESWKDWLKRNI